MLWREDAGVLLHGRRICLTDTGDIPHHAIWLAHSAGHEGTQKTLHPLCADFFIPSDRALVAEWVQSCMTCQRNKTQTVPLAGLLQPPSGALSGVGRHLHRIIEGLPKVRGKSVNLTVVGHPIRCCRSLMLSLMASFGYMGFPPPSSATGTPYLFATYGVTSSRWRGLSFA